MTTRVVQDLLDERAPQVIVGRDPEIAILLEALEETATPLVYFVHGIAGVGKSTLLTAFEERARTAGAAVVHLDAALIEPTERASWRSSKRPPAVGSTRPPRPANGWPRSARGSCS